MIDTAGVTTRLAGIGRLGVAFSGGVDSSVLLALAARVLAPDRVLAVLGVSPSLAADERAAAHAVGGQPWTEEYQVEYLDMNHRVFDRIDAVIGEQVWNFADFATTSGVMRVGGNKKGVFTRDRQPKAAAFTLRRRWRKDA